MDAVSRETTESDARALVDVLFPAPNPAIHRYVDMLSTEGVRRGLLGPREGARIWSRHIVNCAVVAAAFRPEDRVADIGSGAGLPGVVLALARPDLGITLVEPLQRRATFLTEVIATLGVANLQVVRARAEELPDKRSFDVVTARAVAPLARLAEWSMPLVVPGGSLLALKGRSAEAELAGAARRLDKLGVGQRTIEFYGPGLIEPPTTVIRLECGPGP